MTLRVRSWEQRLLAWASEALHHDLTHDNPPAMTMQLQSAYKHCDDITRYHSRTFFMASSLLPDEKRRGARALYAFCRITDDIVDNIQHGVDAQETLEDWRGQIMSGISPTHHPVVTAWANTRGRFGVPGIYARQLIEGVARDLRQTRYQTFDELAEYAYGVASTVGLMAMHIIGFQDDEALPYAIKLGVALQTTNILRDVGEDWRNGRVYLPQEELEAFGLSEGHIATGQVTQRWREFMRFQIDRNRQLYTESIPGIGLLNSDGRFAIGAAAELYRGILDDIEKHDYDVFSRRSHLSMSAKLRRLPGIWWRSRRV